MANTCPSCGGYAEGHDKCGNCMRGKPAMTPSPDQPRETEMTRYRKKPVVIEAWRAEVDAEFPPGAQIRRLLSPSGQTKPQYQVFDYLHDTWINFEIGDWLIQGVQGEFSPIKPDIFAATYEADASSSLPQVRDGFVEPESVFHQLCARAEALADGEIRWPRAQLVSSINDRAGRQRQYRCEGCSTDLVINFPPERLSLPPQEGETQAAVAYATALIETHLSVAAPAFQPVMRQHIERLRVLEAENRRQADELEIERMRLAGCSTAAIQNTDTSRAERIGPNNPYYSAAYGDVCVAVDREMAHRQRAQDAEARLATVEQERDACKLQAQTHAMEARGANATIAEIYQLCSGATGEPGNWHGAEPVRQRLTALQAERETIPSELLTRVTRYLADLCDYGVQDQHPACSLWLKLDAIAAVRRQPPPPESRAVTENVRLISVSMSKWLYASWLTSAERQRIVDEQRRLDQFVKEFEARAGKRWERFNIEPAKRGERRLDRLPIDYKEQT